MKQDPKNPLFRRSAGWRTDMDIKQWKNPEFGCIGPWTANLEKAS
ncbi:MAG: hypothetical protein U5K56_13005 [Halioglobus sp.]|nr:hypothetical protein [Halioglobus sp.]